MQQPPSRQQSKYSDPQMLQRQIMFKQLQELQRKQHLQELGDARSHNYINQLSSLKQASGGQFPTTANGTPILDSSQMFMVGNMQMMQHGGSGGVQGLPNGFIPSQNQYHSGGPVGMSHTQFNASLYGTPAPNSDKNLNDFTHLQGPSVNLLSKTSNMSLGMPPLQPLTFSNSFMSQQCNFLPDQISTPDGSLLINQVFQEKNLFEQSPVQGFSRGIMPGNYSEQGNTMSMNSYSLESDGSHEDTGWHGFTPRKVSKLGMSSLDPLEQKILYNTDDSCWESSFGRSSNMGTGGLAVENSSHIDALPSAQSGSWSALMQSAVAETSSSDTGIQEEWSGLSFQNPEPSADNQNSNFTDSEKRENNWVDRNLQNISSPSQKPENLFQNPNMNCSFPAFQQSGNQFLKHQEGFYSESSHVENQHSPRYTSQLTDWNSQPKQPTGVSQLIQTSSLPLSNIWPGQHKEQSKNVVLQSHTLSSTNDNHPNNNFSGQDLRATSWLHRGTSYPVDGDIQKQFDQVNQMNIHRYSTELEKMAPGNDVEPMSALLSSPDLHGQSETAQSGSMLELLNKDDVSNDHAPGVQLNAKASTSNELPLIKTSAASFAKPCNISPMSKGFGFRLGLTDPRTPQSYSFFPSLPTGNSSAASSSSHNVNDYIKSQRPAPPLPSDVANKFPACSGATSQEKAHVKITHKNGPEFLLSDNLPNQHSATSVVSQHMGFPMGMPSSWPDMTPQKHVSSAKPYKFSNLFGSPDSASSSLETSSGAPTDQPNKNSFEHEPSYQVNHRDNKLLGVPPRDIGSVDHSLNQNYSLLRQVHPPINAETDCGENLPLKYGNVNNQQAIANARELLLGGHKPGIKGKAKSDLNVVSQLGEFSSGVNKGQNFLQEVQGDHSGKASLMAYHQNFQQMEMFGQTESRNHSIGSNEASNVTYGSQISLQMAPSWFKHYGTLKNGQMLPIYDPNIGIDEANRFYGMSHGNFPENNLFMQANSANTSQGSGVWPSAAGTLLVSKQLSPLRMLPSDVTHQNMAVSISKKRKIVSFEMVPWHTEINHEPSSLQNISTAELEWAQASNRRQEEVKVEAEIVEDVLPLVQAKRRLIFTTQLMQKLFRPAPSAILHADASVNCDCVAYTAARLALGDACSLTSQLPSDTKESPDKQKTSKRTNACNFSTVVEDLESRVNRLEGNLSRLECLSLADIKVETQELEKFSIINRFAKFHIKVHSSTTDPTTSSSVSMVQKINPQRYVMALPMPRTVPEGIDCLSL